MNQDTRCKERCHGLRIIFVTDFHIDSLADWGSVYDILDVYPYLTIQQARLIHNFHAVSDIGMKAAMLFNVIDSMLEYQSSLSTEQILLISELVNYNLHTRQSLYDAFERVRKSRGSDIRLILQK